MSKFSVSVWMEIEAEHCDDAYEKADEIETQIMELVSHVENVGLIDVECTEDV